MKFRTALTVLNLQKQLIAHQLMTIIPKCQIFSEVPRLR